MCAEEIAGWVMLRLEKPDNVFRRRCDGEEGCGGLWRLCACESWQEKAAIAAEASELASTSLVARKDEDLDSGGVG